MNLEALDYDLPQALIAQEPAEERESSRLMVIDAGSTKFQHARFSELSSWVPPSLWVLNDTRVFPARVFARKASGGRVELLLLRRLSTPGSEERWESMTRSSKPLREGALLEVEGEEGFEIEVIERCANGHWLLCLRASHGDVMTSVERSGSVPLPPYIARDPAPEDRARYQTVYARNAGAVAAPTAGLHFSDALMSRMRDDGHSFVFVTLHVGPGTFRPIQGDSLQAHPMHSERYVVDAETADQIRAAREKHEPVIAVGTTVVRTLEAVAREFGRIVPARGETDLFIYPPHTFQAVDGMVTNFHLPRSTLLALVMAFGGQETIAAAYREAVAERYRFYSYGDAMLVRGPSLRDTP